MCVKTMILWRVELLLGIALLASGCFAIRSAGSLQTQAAAHQSGAVPGTSQYPAAAPAPSTAYPRAAASPRPTGLPQVQRADLFLIDNAGSFGHRRHRQHRGPARGSDPVTADQEGVLRAIRFRAGVLRTAASARRCSPR